MLSKLKTWLLKDHGYLKLFFIILCGLVLAEELYVFFFEKPTLTRTIKEKLNKDHFPEILICPEPSSNTTELQRLGYLDFYYYAGGFEIGLDGETTKVPGWSGNGTANVTEVSQQIAVLKTDQDCAFSPYSLITYSFSLDDLEAFEPLEFELVSALYPMHKCCKIKRPKQDKMPPILQIITGNFSFNKIRVLLADPFSASIFTQHVPTTFGDRIKTPEKDTSGMSLYTIKITEEIHLEEDPSYPCIDTKGMVSIIIVWKRNLWRKFLQ